MPDVIKSAAHQQSSTGVGHDLPHLFAAFRIITVYPAMLAARFFMLQRALLPFSYGVLQKGCTFRAEDPFSQSIRQSYVRAFHIAVFSGTVHLDKFAKQPDIFFLLKIASVHSCDIIPVSVHLYMTQINYFHLLTNSQQRSGNFS